jgi:hypothetical protein
MPISNKPLKDPHDFILPFKVIFPEPITMKVNLVQLYFPAKEEVELNQSEFSNIYHSQYGKYLK